MPHQEKALDFMAQREQGPVPQQYQLWTKVGTEHGGTWCHHKIAVIKSRILPKETGGGILADEMGMGKTLCTLALITNTLADADAWRCDHVAHLDDEIPPDKSLPRATLVVVPTPLLLSTWLAEINEHIKLTLKTLVYHGDRRSLKPQDLAEQDIVLTTYRTLVSDGRNDSNIIQDIAWYRIVLDEAHFIRNQSTFMHKRVAELQAKFRWCLTGTPVQNNSDDIGALFAFLRIFPFDRLGTFRRYVTNLWHESGSRKLEGQQNLATLLDSICLRRTKGLLNLTDIEEHIQFVQLSEAERFQYDQTKEDMKRAMHNIVDDYDDGNRFGMFQAQLQLRLLCNHGTFQHRFHWMRSRGLTEANKRDLREDLLSLSGRNGDTFCSSCHTVILSSGLDNAYELPNPCNHILCSYCQAGNGTE